MGDVADRKPRKVSKGLSHLGNSPPAPTSSLEREPKRPCRSMSSFISSDVEESEIEMPAIPLEEGTEAAPANNLQADESTAAPVEIETANIPKKDADSLYDAKQDTDSREETQMKINLHEQIKELNVKISEMEHQVCEVIKLRKASTKEKALGLNVKDQDRERAGVGSKKQRQMDLARRESSHSKRMGELIRQFGTVLRQITQHKWAWPFMQPVDVKGLNLHDYYDIIKRPMDFSTIKEKMDSRDGNGYKSLQEIAVDMRLVFSNAMTYNEAGTDVHVMAKTLSEKFEEKWKAVLEPKWIEEEVKRKQEVQEFEAMEVAEVKAAEDAALDRLSNSISKQLNDLEERVEILKAKATSKCRPMTIEEKRQLGQNLGRLPPTCLNRVIQIIGKTNPGFNATAEEVEVDIAAQDTSTLWQLHCYVQLVLNNTSKEHQQ